MWKTDEFEYVWEDDRGEHVWYVTINYQAGYKGSNSGSHDAFYEDLQDEYEIAAVLGEEKGSTGYERIIKTVHDIIEIDDAKKQELIEYYIEQQKESTNNY